MARIGDIFKDDPSIIRRIDQALGNEEGDMLVFSVTRDTDGGMEISLHRGNANTGACDKTGTYTHSSRELAEAKQADLFALFLVDTQAGIDPDGFH